MKWWCQQVNLYKTVGHCSVVAIATLVMHTENRRLSQLLIFGPMVIISTPRSVWIWNIASVFNIFSVIIVELSNSYSMFGDVAIFLKQSIGHGLMYFHLCACWCVYSTNYRGRLPNKCWAQTEIIRHSRLPAGNALWFCQNFLFLFFFILPPPRFPDDNFWPPSRTAPEF